MAEAAAPALPAPPVDCLLNNLGILDSFWFIPPHVESGTHASTSVSPVHHINVPLRFIYDPHALDGLSARLRHMLEAGPLPLSVETKIRQQLLEERRYYRDKVRPHGVRIRRPTRVQHEAGLQENMVQRLLLNIVDRERQRTWRTQGAPYDLGLFQRRVHNDDDDEDEAMGMEVDVDVDARGSGVRIVTEDLGSESALLHLEVKSGYNDDPEHPTDGEDDPNETYGQSVVLGPHFFKALIKYLDEHGPVVYRIESESLSNYPATVVMRDGSTVWYTFEDGRDQENISRVLCQMRTEFCKTLYIYPNNRYNKYLVLSTFRDSVLFTLRPDAITISPIVSSRGRVTPQRPIGNLAALIYVLSHLDEEEYGVITVPQHDARRRGLRGGGPGNHDGDGEGDGPDHPSGGGGGRRGQGGGEQGRDGGPLQGQRLEIDDVDESIDVPDDPDSSFSTEACSSTAITDNPSTAPTSPLSALFPGNGIGHSHGHDNDNDKTRALLNSLKIDFDQLHDCVAGDTLPNSHSPGSKIFQLGTYLSHHCLSRIDFSPLDTELLAGTDTVETATSIHRLEVDGYLGIGAVWTAFSAKSHLGKDTTDTSTTRLPLAIKFCAPDLYPRSPHRRKDGWTRTKVIQSVQREISAYHVLRQSQFGSEQEQGQGAGGIAPRCHGIWSGTSRSLGRVACMVLEKGQSIGDVSDLDQNERQQIVDLFVKLHSIGIIHRDVSLSNICRIRSPGAFEASAPVLSSSSAPAAAAASPVRETTSGSGAVTQPPMSPASTSMSKGRMVIIDFGAAAFSPALSASGIADVGRGSTEGMWESVPDTPMVDDIPEEDLRNMWTEDEWEMMKRDEMRRVVELVKLHPCPPSSSSSAS